VQPPTGQGDASKWLALRALGGQIVIIALTVLLAGHLTLVQFEAYAVTASLFLFLVAVAPLGADKLALRVVPRLLETGDMRRVAGFLRFAVRRLAIGTLAVAAVGLTWGLSHEAGPSMRAAIVAGAVALPAGILAHLGLDVLTATGRVREATAIVRIAVPGCVLMFVAAAIAAGATLSGAAAIAAWGVAWVAAVVLMLRLLRRDLAPALHAKPVVETAAWRAAAWPLWLYRIAVGLQAQTGILALDWLGASPASVGAYAAATVVTSPALVLATSTNRAYSRDLTILIARRDAAGLIELARRRRRWLLPVLALYLMVAFTFAEQLLNLFRREFVAAGTWPIRIIAVAAAVSIAFSLAPTVLEYHDRNALVLGTVATAVAVQTILLAFLVPSFGATGAALSYCASVVLMYARFVMAGRSDLARLAEETASRSAGIEPRTSDSVPSK
jgi:O-antigen/teichoic acid export membrane protein